MANENILTQTSQGNITFESPDQSTVAVNQQGLGTTENVGALTSFALGVKEGFGTIYRAAGDYLTRNTNVDTTYNPIHDPLVKFRGEEFINKYGDYLIDSPNAEYTIKALKEIDDQEVIKSAMAQNPISGMLGTLTGSLVDPINFVPFLGLGKYSKSASVAIGAAQGAALGAVAGAADYQLSTERDASNIGLSALFGTAMGGVVGLLAPEVATLGGGKALLKEFDEPMSGLTEPMKPQPVITEGTGAQYVGSGFNPVEESAAYGTKLAEFIFKGAQRLSPNQKLLNNSLGSARFLASKLGGYAGVLKKNLDGVATDWDIASMYEVRMANKRNNINKNLDPLFKEYKAEGGTGDYPDFVREAMYAHGVEASKFASVNKAASKLNDHFSTMWDEGVASGIFKADAKKPDKYIPHYWDMDKITRDHLGFLDMVKSQIKKDHPQLSEADLTNEAYAIVDDLKANEFSNGGSVMRKAGFKNKSSLYRTFNVENDLAWKYIRDDWDVTLDRYNSNMELAKVFASDSRFDASKNPYDALAQLIHRDKEEQILLATKSGENKDLINKKIEKINKDADEAINISHGLLDALTGQADSRLGLFGNKTVRTTSKLLRTYSTLNLMGSNVLSQIPDMFRALAYKIYDKVGFSPMASSFAENFIKLNNEDKAFFAYHIQNSGDFSRAGKMFDLQDVNDMGSKVERLASRAVNSFFNLTLVNWFNRFNYNMLAHDAVRNVLSASEKLLDGKLEKGSFEAIELARFGIDKVRAREILDQYNKHKTIVPDSSDKVFDPQVSLWDSSVGLEFAANIQRYVSRIIISPTLGSKPIFTNTSIGRVLTQFKSFQYAAFESGLMNTAQTLGLTSTHTQQTLATMLLMSLGGVATQLAKDANSGREIKITPEYVAFAAFNNGGVFPMFDYASNIADKYGFGMGTLLGQREKSKFIASNALDPFLGPSFGLVGSTLPTAVGSIAKVVKEGDMNEKDFSKIMRAMPAQNLLYWNYLVKQLTDGK